MTTRFVVWPAGRSKWTSILGVVLSTATVFGPIRVVLSQTPEYIISELVNAGQVPRRLNNLGDLAGSGPVGGQTSATIWNHGTLKAQHLGALPGGEYSSAFAINDAGQVAGASNIHNAIVPFIRKQVGGLQRIPLLPGDKCGQAFGINKNGHVAGYSSGPNGAKAFLWVPGTGIRNLASLPGGNYSRARAVNDSDEVVGTSGSSAGDRAVLWTKTGNIRDLGTLPGDTSSEAIAINNPGDVVGCSKGPGGMRAFLWNPVIGMQDLGVLPGRNVSRALDINDLGYVVGSSSISSSDHAFIWTKQTGMTDLNSAASAGLGLVFVEARAINKAGKILVMGNNTHLLNADGDMALPEHDNCAPAPPITFLLTPTP
jgi:probable HAF family extracellular repeat protein